MHNFRPQKFSEVLGQETTVTTLKNAIKLERVSHAYLFCGPRGVGKTTLARILAKALNCHEIKDHEPCGSCHSCKEIAEGRSLDVIEIDGASNRGIDDIRTLSETAGYATSGKCKIYIIDEVHMLTKEAFNALLKTLEEPPAKVHFFFATTEPHKIPPTIISRVQRFDLARISDAVIAKKLEQIATNEKVEIDNDAIMAIAHLSEGGLRDAEHLYEQIVCYAEQPITLSGVEGALGLLPRDDFFALDKAASESNLKFAGELAEKIFSSGKDVGHVLDMLADHYRFLLQMHLLGKTPPFDAERFALSAKLYTTEQLGTILELILYHAEQLSKSNFKRLHLELLLIQIIKSMKQIRIDTIAKQLLEMKGEEPKAAKPSKSTSNKSDAELDTLVRFAGVELGGVVK